MLAAAGDRARPRSSSWSPTTTRSSGACCSRAEIEGRADDTAERHPRTGSRSTPSETAPLAALYARPRPAASQVDGIGPVDEVTARLLAALGVAGDVAVS